MGADRESDPASSFWCLRVGPGVERAIGNHVVVALDLGLGLRHLSIPGEVSSSWAGAFGRLQLGWRFGPFGHAWSWAPEIAIDYTATGVPYVDDFLCQTVGLVVGLATSPPVH
jgi:hypothetical protein